MAIHARISSFHLAIGCRWRGFLGAGVRLPATLECALQATGLPSSHDAIPVAWPRLHSRVAAPDAPDCRPAAQAGTMLPKSATPEAERK